MHPATAKRITKTTSKLANENSNTKFFRINLEMRGNKLEYDPSLDENAHNSFMQMIKTLMADICSVTGQIKKIAQPMHGTTAADSAITYQSTLCLAIQQIFVSREEKNAFGKFSFYLVFQMNWTPTKIFCKRKRISFTQFEWVHAMRTNTWNRFCATITSGWRTSICGCGNS